jgi:ribose 5-phosphate isomerase B
VEKQKIAIVSDHAGYYLKEKLVKFLIRENIKIKDMGCNSPEAVDYPDFGHPLAEAVSDGLFDIGISICGTGNGINMTVNKHQGIRSALCWTEEVARMSRAHNNANICALPAWYLNESEAYLIIRTFLNTPFEGGRHQRRIEKISLKMY